MTHDKENNHYQIITRKLPLRCMHNKNVFFMYLSITEEKQSFFVLL